MDQVNVKCRDFGDEWGFYIDIESINNAERKRIENTPI